MINYLPSFTAPGHTCIYTGSVPAIHGITGNEWLEKGKFIYCTDDKTVSPVGGSKRWGQMSPRNLLSTTITDELRLATNLRSQVFGISLKDRSSILPAGHLGKAYWFDDSSGTFSTSSYYGDALPQWVQRFNEKRWPDTILAEEWKLADRLSEYDQVADDAPRYEGKFSQGEPGTSFPHSATYFKGSGALRYTTLRKLPMGNWLTLQFARRCVKANKLGQGSDPDFLCLSLSATDYAGHQFGPNALEMEDMFVRLDRQLARFLNFLDEEVGQGQYTVFLTAAMA
jgi:predicted AlkP superfamily pyrophosphatase or phosphodiesterase